MSVLSTLRIILMHLYCLPVKYGYSRRPAIWRMGDGGGGLGGGRTDLPNMATRSDHYAHTAICNVSFQCHTRVMFCHPGTVVDVSVCVCVCVCVCGGGHGVGEGRHMYVSGWTCVCLCTSSF